MRTRSAAITAAYLALTNITARADCTASSPDRRVPLLELYTSEGCDSCPPTDRWASALGSRGLASDRVVVLAFHVDYWDRLGWTDRFAQARFSARQREVNDRIRSRVVYTPQLILNGKDYRRRGDDEFARNVADVNRDHSRAAIRYTLQPAADRVQVSGTWSAPDAKEAQAWLALYENRLSTQVGAGENRGKRLEHDFVVRDLAGPFAQGSFAHGFTLDKSWNRSNLGVASFVQEPRSGDVLQAVAKGWCGAGEQSGVGRR